MSILKRTYCTNYDYKSHPTYKAGVPTIHPMSKYVNAKNGTVKFSKKKALWFTTMIAGGTIGTFLTFDPVTIYTDLMFFFGTTGTCVLFGHSLGMHRKLIHESYDCPNWLKYLLVHFGTLMGIDGPIGMMKAHDLRDWAQRQPKGECHSFYSQQEKFYIDSHRQMCCILELENSPEYVLPDQVKNDKVLLLMEKYWMIQQLPWAVLFYLLGGWSWVVWGICVRVLAGMYGHFSVGWFAHNDGFWAKTPWTVNGAAVQGRNLGQNSLISRLGAVMTGGEIYHNNHHAYPGSAKLSYQQGEIDIGYNILKLLEKFGLVWNIKTQTDLPLRPELIKN